jgi:hypothetical protein
MAIDPTLTKDNCTRMAPSALPSWWLSDDVKLINPASGVAQQGATNTVQVTVRKAAGQCSFPAAADFIKVELYVCDPTGSPFGSIAGNTKVKKIGEAQADPSLAQDVKQIAWAIPAVPTHDAEKTGHKCLIARAAANTLLDPTGNNSLNFLPDDQHYAQHNICISMCSSPCGQELWTGNPDKEGRPKDVVFQLFADLRPSKDVLGVALPLLQTVPGFGRVVNTPPRLGFALEMPDFPTAKMTDHSKAGPKGCMGALSKWLGGSKPQPAGGQPSFSAQVRIEPGQLSTYRFVTDLDGYEKGDAHIFHLMHTEAGQVLSGITILMLKV